MSAESEFFFGSKSSVREYETLEMSHPNFSKIYRVVRNARSGLTATIETGEVVFFEFLPLRLTDASMTGDLDYNTQIDFGDLGELLPAEFDRVRAADGFGIKPLVILRTYLSGNLTVPLIGPLRLQSSAFTNRREGASFVAGAPSLNVSKTGIPYTIALFPMMRGGL
jgi:hypothetical protein